MNRTTCTCNCGYTCGGPGRCEYWDEKPMGDELAGIQRCLREHFKKDCGHDFSGPLEDIGNRSWSVLCNNCGLSAAAHDEMRGP